MDFSTDAIDITFQADERATLDLKNQIDVDIPIFNDQIDEADREYFILHLSLVDDPLPGLHLGTTVSVGGIDDNDSRSKIFICECREKYLLCNNGYCL